MKIVHAVYSNRKGGLEQAFVNVTKMLLSLGHEVELWVPKQAFYSDNKELPCARFDLSSHGYFDLWAMVRHHWRLRSALPDIIITHNSRATSLMLRASKGLNIPILAFSHGYKTHRLRKVDHLVVLTEDMKQHFIAAGHRHDRVSVFPNVIDSIPEIPSWFAPSQNKPILLGFVGRMNEEKGLEDLLHALAMLKDSYALELHIAGSGPDQERITLLADKLGIGSLIHFSGWVEDIQEWMKSVDLIVVPSRSESFGIVILEAAAYGRPVIATDIAGPASQIRHGVDGWLAQPNSSESLSNTIDEALNNKGRWSEIRQAAHHRAHSYLMSTKVDQLQEILNQVKLNK